MLTLLFVFSYYSINHDQCVNKRGAQSKKEAVHWKESKSYKYIIKVSEFKRVVSCKTFIFSLSWLHDTNDFLSKINVLNVHIHEVYGVKSDTFGHFGGKRKLLLLLSCSCLVASLFIIFYNEPFLHSYPSFHLLFLSLLFWPSEVILQSFFGFGRIQSWLVIVNRHPSKTTQAFALCIFLHPLF